MVKVKNYSKPPKTRGGIMEMLSKKKKQKNEEMIVNKTGDEVLPNELKLKCCDENQPILNEPCFLTNNNANEIPHKNTTAAAVQDAVIKEHEKTVYMDCCCNENTQACEESLMILPNELKCCDERVIQVENFDSVCQDAIIVPDIADTELQNNNSAEYADLNTSIIDAKECSISNLVDDIRSPTAPINFESIDDENEPLNNEIHQDASIQSGINNNKISYVQMKKKHQKENAKSKHPLRFSTCENTVQQKCKNGCIRNIDLTQRELIHNQFWNLDTHEQRRFILSICSKVPVQTKSVNPKKKNRDSNYRYYLKGITGEKFPVCKNFFLTTLGYHPKNDKVVFNVLHNAGSGNISPPADKRGSSTPSTIVDRVLINEHIQSFHPSISHYRREHAPNVKYLPNDVTKTSMFADFKQKYPEINCCYETYRKVVQQENIHFTVLGHEQCETCKIADNHKTVVHGGLQQTDCGECLQFEKHLEKARKARASYKLDASTKFDESTMCISTDMEKVIMLPRMEQYKVAIFTKRLATYNQTFVPVGNLKTERTFSAVWHCGIAGRNKEELISTYNQFLLFNRDKKRIIIWVDNCSAQNKNWALFTFFVTIINSNEINAEEIEIKYFESGHTFMSSDSFHHQVELSMKHSKNVYDFRDFSSAVGNAGKNVTVHEMQPNEFYIFPDLSVTKKCNGKNDKFLLKNVVCLKFIRGSLSMLAKEDYEQSEWNEVTFLKKNVTKSSLLHNRSCLQGMTSPKGVPKDVKIEIIKKLTPLMPASRQEFWKELNVQC